MIPKGLFTQIGMIIIAVATIMTYIMPTFKEISAVQDEIKKFEDKKNEVYAVNSKLADLVSEVSSVPIEDHRKLNDYLPDEVDVIAIPKDLFIISKEAGVLYKNSVSSGDKDNSSSAEGEPTFATAHSFDLSVEGTYSQLKQLFSLLEKNHYPLQVGSLDITKLDGPLLSAEIGLVTYAYKNPSDSTEQQDNILLR